MQNEVYLGIVVREVKEDRGMVAIRARSCDEDVTLIARGSPILLARRTGAISADTDP